MRQLHQPSHIMVIDQNRLFREKIAFLLSQDQEQHYHIIANFDDLEEGLQFLNVTTVNLLLIEAALLQNDLALNHLKSTIKNNPQLQIILLTSAQQPFLYAQIQRLGIVHTLTKTIDNREFLTFVAKVLQHQTDDNALNYLEDLTPRELEILEWLVKGDSNKEIARELAISESTVKVHVQNILKKFKVSSRVEAAVYAVRNELSA